MKKFTDFKMHITESSGNLTEGKMNDLSVSIGDHMDKHIDNYKKYGGAEDLMSKAGHVAKKIAKQHKLKIQHAHNFVRDYMEKRLNESVELEESVKIVDRDSDLDQEHFKLHVNGKTEHFVHHNYENSHASDSKAEIHYQVKNQLKHLSPQHQKEVTDAVHASYRIKEEVELTEGRPSHRHPLEGHEYHKKTDAELEHIGKDAHKAAEAMKGHNEKAENKYRDQANDAATVRYFRKKSGTPDWYKKKYGLVKEETELNESVNEKQIKKDLDSGMSHDAVIGKHSNKKFTNTNEIRKVIQKHAWDKRMKKEEVEINERSLTSSEEEKVEDIVKGMKKNKSDFKERYGKRAREVMYATATKLAQNEEVFHEDSIGAKVTRQWNRLTKPLDQAKKDIDSPGMKRWERDQRLSVGRGTPEDVASRDKEAVDTLDKTRKDIHKNYATKESYSSEDGILDEMTISGFRTTRDLTKHLKKNGWSLGRTTGGHDVFVHATNKNNIAVPRHKGDIPPGTVRNIIKTAGLHNEDVDLSESRKADIVKDAWKTAKAKNLKNSDNQTNVESESDQRKDIFQKDPEMGGKIVKQ